MKTRWMLLFYLLLTLFTAEILLDIFYPREIIWKPADETALHTYLPHKTGLLIGSEFRTVLETNHLGFRQKGIEGKKITTLVFGSQVEGIGVHESEIYVNLLNKKEGYQYLIAGNTRISPILYGFLFRWLYPIYKPQKVILEVSDDDLEKNLNSEKRIQFSEDSRPVLIEKSFLQSILGTNLYNRFFSLNLPFLLTEIFQNKKSEFYKITKEPNEKVYSPEEAKVLSQTTPRSLHYINPKASPEIDLLEYKQELRKNQRYLEEFIGLAKENSVKIEIIYIPSKKNREREQTKTDCLSFENPNRLYSLQLESICSKNQISCILLDKIWSEEEFSKYLFPWEGVLNKEGHSQLSKILLSTH
jgi:hypothetical protein